MTLDPRLPQKPADQWLRLINAYLDESILKEEFELLSEWIAASPDNAMWFARVASLHSGLRTTLQQQDLREFLAAKDSDGSLELTVDPQNIQEMLVEFDEAERRREEIEATQRAKQIAAEAAAKRMEQLEQERLDRPHRPQPIEIPRSALWAAIAVGVAFVFLAVDALMLQQEQQADMTQVAPPVETRPAETFASVSDSVAAVWARITKPIGPGGRLPAGRLNLIEGAVELTFDDGAQVVLEAPVEVELVSASRLWLQRGKMVAKVPEEAIGFTVSTAAGSIVDLGTEFGVGVTDTGDTQVQVMQGVVALAAKSSGENVPRLTLTEGQARYIQAEGSQISKLEFDEQAYLRNVPSSPYELAVMRDRPFAYWRFDGTGNAVESIGRVESNSPLGSGVSLVGLAGQAQVGSAAAEFSGAHDGIMLSDLASELLKRDFTLEAWVKPIEIPESTGAMRILSNFYSSAGIRGGWGFGVADERFVGAQIPRRVLLFTMHGVYDSISTQTMTFGEWTHLAVTVDSRAQPAMYINGSEVIEFCRDWKTNKDSYKPIPKNANYTDVDVTSKNPFLIGRHPPIANEGNPPEAWHGSIDELAVFTRVLTPAEILEHYQASSK